MKYTMYYLEKIYIYIYIYRTIFTIYIKFINIFIFVITFVLKKYKLVNIKNINFVYKYLWYF